jgi:PAS domain S-box-containing protein
MSLLWAVVAMVSLSFALDRLTGIPIDAKGGIEILFAITCMACVGLLRRERYATVAWLMVALLFSTTAATAYFFGTARTVTIFLLAAGQVVVGVFLSQRALLWTTLAAVGVLLGITWADVQGLLIDQLPPPVGLRTWSAQAVAVIAVAMIVFVNRTQMRTIQESLVSVAQQRMKIEADRNEGLDHFKLILEASPTPILLQSGRGGAILDVNPAFERVTGYARKDLLNRAGGFLWVKNAQLEAFVQSHGNQLCTDWMPITCLCSDGSTLAMFIRSEVDEGSEDRVVTAMLQVASDYAPERSAAPPHGSASATASAPMGVRARFSSPDTDFSSFDSRPIEHPSEVLRYLSGARYTSLKWMLMGIAMLMFGLAVEEVLIAPKNDSRVGLAAIMGCIALLAYVALGVFRSKFMNLPLVMSVVLMGGWAMFDFGTVRASSSLSMIAAVVLAGAFLSRSYVVLVAVACLIVLGALTWAEAHGLLATPNFDTGIRFWSLGCAVLLIIGAVLSYMRRATDEAHVRLLNQMEDRSRLEQERDQWRRNFSRIFRLNPTPLMIHSSSSQTVLDVNPAFEHCFGHSHEQLLGRGSKFMWADGKTWQTHLEDLLFRGQEGWMDGQGLASDGRHFPVCVRSVLSGQQSGSYILTTVVMLQENKCPVEAG